MLPFETVVVIGDRAVFSGHGPQADDGSVAGPFGKVGGELTIEQGCALCGLLAYLVNWAVFVLSNAAQTEHYYDLTGSLTYITLIVVALVLSDVSICGPPWSRRWC